MTLNLQQYCEIAQKAARSAGNIQLAALSEGFTIETKSSVIDLVTTVDKACDTHIRSEIQQLSDNAKLPVAHFLTEETFVDDTPIDLSHTWVIDPIDGTTNFAHRLPHFCVSIAYFHQGQPWVGVIYDANRDECFTAIRGQGAFLNGQPIQVSKIDTLPQSLLATGFAYNMHAHPNDNIPLFLAFMTKTQGVRRPGAAALDLAYVACGRLDGYWEKQLSIWDIAAGVLLLEEAGGQWQQLSGLPFNWHERHLHIVSANAALFSQMMAVVNEVLSSSSADEPTKLAPL